ncbi:MAG: PilT/PilU family type 4a pilus ATPase, partial [Candidatus Dormibacteraeota bacterium]|nr:PilT/PilU family type 4a pilus ATPase [Candidatus Dormibacteraeota bacterium]
RGSDLLLSPGASPRVRRDGVLHVLWPDAQPLTEADTAALLRPLLTPEQAHALEADRSLDFAFTWRESARLRANLFYQRGGLAAVFRALPLHIPGFDELGVPEPVRALIGRHQGLVLVTGPTGSGKSTTQAAMIDHLNRTQACHVITVEDPIEYIHAHALALVDQREIGSDALSFPQALRVAFREDADVVLIGEMRDPETIEAALGIAETGHLVIATLHTNDSAQALDRVIDSFPAGRHQQVRTQLANTLAGVVYQQLLPAVGGGRVAAFEVLIVNSAVRTLLKDGKTNQIRTHLQTNVRDGSQTLERHLSRLVAEGRVSEDDARQRSLYPDEIGRT